MSFDALSWAAKQSPGSSGAKLVLLGLAECAGRKDGRAFPSIAELVEFSSLNRKSVIANLDKLEAGGFIADTGERVGHTKQIKVYSLSLQTVPKAVQSQKRNGSVSSAKSTENGTRNLSEPVVEKDKPSQQRHSPKSPFILPSDIPQEPWSAFEEMRRRIGKPLTDYARWLAVSRLHTLAEDGWPPGDVLNHSTLNNYQGLFPPKDRSNGQRTDPLRGTRPSPALALARRGAAREAAESASQDGTADWGAGAALPAIGAGGP